MRFVLAVALNALVAAALMKTDFQLPGGGGDGNGYGGPERAVYSGQAPVS